MAPPQSPKSDITQCPSKEIFSAVTFWNLNFYQKEDIFGRKPFSVGFEERYGCLTWTMGNRDILLKWEEQGAILSFRGLDESDKYIDGFWAKREKAIRSACNGCEVEYISGRGEVPTINITLLKTPISAMTVASVEEKKAYADLLNAKFKRISLLICRFISDLESEGLKEVDFERSEFSDSLH